MYGACIHGSSLGPAFIFPELLGFVEPYVLIRAFAALLGHLHIRRFEAEQQHTAWPSQRYSGAVDDTAAYRWVGLRPSARTACVAAAAVVVVYSV